MKKCKLLRIETSNEGTFGILTLPSGTQLYTLELPYRDVDADGLSDKGRSCLPAGTYVFRWKHSPKHGDCYEADHDTEAPNRDHVQVHSANFAGDVTKDYVSQLEGCIAPGRAIHESMDIPAAWRTPTRSKQKGISSSKDAVACLVLELGKMPFELEIAWKEGVSPEEKKA